MLLYKSRGFGEYFQDTFAFLKQNGKHLYKHFFIINGAFLLILMVMTYFISKFYTDIVFGGFVNGNVNALEKYINENSGLFALLFIVFLIIGVVAAIISYAFVPIYLKLYVKHDGKHFSASDIIKSYKHNIGKILVFLICGLLILIPIAIFAGIVSFILSITIIGMLLLPLVVGGVSLFYQGGLMEYLEQKKGIWESFGYFWSLMSRKFWAAIGSVGIFFVMAYLAQMVVTFVPYIFGIVNLFIDVEPGYNPDPTEIQKTMTIILLVIFLLSFIVGSLLNVIVQLNQGVIFYSLKEDNENINTKSDIDLIGEGE
ncbi:hypothetical protein [Psychroserpens algicola]|uniref:hypothetical protein n=1 Tax=Psychroserpens algicola TaxID=1719034 RepID=UPI001954EE39|nr:hypothetical protein [Psychroserpens algicola]